MESPSQTANHDDFEEGITNLHILPDDKFNQGFVDGANEFDASADIFWSIPSDSDGIGEVVEEITYFDSPDVLLKSLGSIKPRRVYIHALAGWREWVLRKMDSEIPTTWIVYGYDVYKRLPFKKIYEPRTRALRYAKKKRMSLSDWIYFARYCRPRPIRYINQRRYLSKLDSIAFWLPHDCEAVKSFFHLDLEFIEFAYSGLFPEPEVVKESTGSIESILVGNSANSSNNHIDAFHELSKKRFSGKIYCPLSYSGGELYVDAVISEGKSMFGSNFVALTDYMPKQDYFDLIDSIDAAFFYHRRQQAGSNALYFLRSGKPVFLHPKSPMLPYFQAMNVKLMLSTDEFSQAPNINTNQVKGSKRIIKSWLSQEKKISRYKRLLTY